MIQKTLCTYKDRKSKMRYVWQKYKKILTGEILDVGADSCEIKKLLNSSARYTGIGLGGDCNPQINLEMTQIPFEKNSFDCVLCLDVLEHLENIHNVLFQILSLSKKYVIISLPNPLKAYISTIINPNLNPTTTLKFYGLPHTPPTDRHKWFFSAHDAKNFIEYHAKKNNYSIFHMDFEFNGDTFPASFFANENKDSYNLYNYNLAINAGTMWCVLKKNE